MYSHLSVMGIAESTKQKFMELLQLDNLKKKHILTIAIEKRYINTITLSFIVNIIK